MELKKVAKKEERAHEGKPYWRIQTEGEGGKSGIWLSCWDKTIADKCIVGAVMEMEWESKLSKDGKYTNNTLTKAEPSSGTLPEPASTQAPAGQSAAPAPDAMSKGDWEEKEAREHRRAILNTLIMAGRRAVKDSKDKTGALNGKVEGDKNFFDEARLLWEWVKTGPRKAQKEEELFPDE